MNIVVGVFKYGFVLALGIESVVIVWAIALLAREQARHHRAVTSSDYTSEE